MHYEYDDRYQGRSSPVSWGPPIAPGPVLRAFTSFAPISIVQSNVQAMRSSSPITLRSVSPVPYQQPVGSPVLTHQRSSPIATRYPSPIPGNLRPHGGLYSLPPPVSFQVHSSPTLHAFQPPNLLPGRSSPILGISMDGQATMQLQPAGFQTANFQTGNSFVYQEQADPSLQYVARMQQRQSAKQLMEMEWQHWEGHAGHSGHAPPKECDLSLQRHVSGIRESRGISPSRVRVADHGAFHARAVANSTRQAQHMIVTVIAARNLPAIKGTCNPYCTIRYGRHVQKTSVCFESINPRWNQPSSMNVSESDTDIGISVLHWDQTGNEELIGVVSFTTSQVKAGLAERSFVIKYLDGTAIIGNDGCPAYLDIAVVIGDHEVGRENPHDLRRAPSPRTASPLLPRPPSLFELQRPFMPEHPKPKPTFQHSSASMHTDVQEEINYVYSRDRMGLPGDRGPMEPKVFTADYTSQEKSLFQDNSLGSLQEFQRNSFHELQRSLLNNLPRASVHETYSSSIQEPARSWAPVRDAHVSPAPGRDAHVGLDAYHASVPNSKLAALPDAQRASTIGFEKAVQDGYFERELERCLTELQRNSVINPQRSSLGSINRAEVKADSRVGEGVGSSSTNLSSLIFASQDIGHYGGAVENEATRASKQVPSLYASNAEYGLENKDKSLYYVEGRDSSLYSSIHGRQQAEKKPQAPVEHARQSHDESQAGLSAFTNSNWSSNGRSYHRGPLSL